MKNLILIPIIIAMAACAGMREDYSKDYARFAEAKASCQQIHASNQQALEIPMQGGGVFKMPVQMLAGYSNPCDMDAPVHAGAYAASVANKAIGVGGAVAGGAIAGDVLKTIAGGVATTISANDGSNVTVGNDNITSGLPQTHSTTSDVAINEDGSSTTSTTESSTPFVPEPVIVEPVIVDPVTVEPTIVIP